MDLLLCSFTAVSMICWYMMIYSKTSVFLPLMPFLPLPLQAVDKHGLTPLLSACYENHVSCAKVLLEKVGTLI